MKFMFFLYFCSRIRLQAMKKILMTVAVTMLTAMTANAQRIRVTDSEGQAVPFVTILNDEGAMIGTTDIEGMSEDLQGAGMVVLTHVAFKPRNVIIKSDGQQVTLEDADYTMPEITVEPKPYTYLQIYYRIVMIRKDGVQYYRVGLVDNFYNEEKGKQESSKRYFSKSIPGLKMAGDIVAGFIVDNKAKIHAKPWEQRLLDRYKDQGMQIVSAGNGKKQISDNYGTLGSITDKEGQRRISFDSYLAALHEMEAENKTKKVEKIKKFDAKAQNAVRNSYLAYSIDDSGNYRPEDFLMEQHLYSADYEKYGHCLFVMDFFATDRSYVSKEGMKQIKQAGKAKMSYEWAQQFEHEHNIPALAPEIAAKVKGLAEGN